MENITIGQIVTTGICLSTLIGFFIAIFKFYKTNFSDKFDKLDERVATLEQKTEEQDKEIKESKEERLILLKGQLACLKGLSEQGCDGPVTEAISSIESYLMNKTHE